MGGFLSEMLGLLVDLFVWLTDAVWHAALWIIMPIVEPLLDAVLDYIPAPEDSTLTSFMIECFEYANYWVPLGEGFGMLFAYYTFVVIVAAVRSILKIIPGIW